MSLFHYEPKAAATKAYGHVISGLLRQMFSRKGVDEQSQTFDVYSPKILAAIAGLEDVLASRCIALPMRRTMQKLPVFPANFEGAALRHQFYTLALTAFKKVRINYFTRPELHTLNNRLAELWSPLIALAAFFEERGDIEGLVAMISTATQQDVEICDGRALSDKIDRAQVLDMMQRYDVQPLATTQ